MSDKKKNKKKDKERKKSAKAAKPKKLLRELHSQMKAGYVAFHMRNATPKPCTAAAAPAPSS